MNLFRHGGSQAEKVTFYIKIESVALPLMKGVAVKDSLIAIIERKGKTKITKPHMLQEPAIPLGDMTATFNETLPLSVTMYKTAKGKYEEKSASMQIKHAKAKSKKYEVIGVVPLEFHDYMANLGVLLTLPLTQCAAHGAYVHLRISTTNKSIVADDDDISSVASVGSKKSPVPDSLLRSSSTMDIPFASKSTESVPELISLNSTNEPKKSLSSAGIKPLVPIKSAPDANSNPENTHDSLWSGFADFDAMGEFNHSTSFENQTPETSLNAQGHDQFVDAFGDWGTTAQTNNFDWSDANEKPSRGSSDPFATQSMNVDWKVDGQESGGHESGSVEALNRTTGDSQVDSSNFITQEERIRRAREAAKAGVTVMAANQQLKLQAHAKLQQLPSKPATNIDEVVEILTMKANYFENESQRLIELVNQLREERDLLLAHKTLVEEQLSVSLAENSSLGSSLASSKLLISYLASRVEQQQCEIQTLRLQNADMVAELCVYEVSAAESKIELLNKKLDNVSSNSSFPASPPLHQSVSEVIARTEMNSPLTPTAKGKAVSRTGNRR